MSGKPTPIFYLALGLMIVLLLGVAVWRGCDMLMPDGGNVVNSDGKGKGGDIDPNELGIVDDAEAPDTFGITTVQEYEFKPSEKLPKVEGTAAYEKLEDNTIKFALNVWAGWAPIIHANGGFEAKKIWKDADGKDFKVELVLIDDPVAMRDAYANGNVHIGWATLDMVPLFLEGFGDPIDSRVMPRIYQQIDWSNGGDGIVVRGDIKTVADLRGKKIALAENSPSEYFILNMLVAAGVQPSEVEFANAGDAFAAAAAFNTDKSIDACVSWAPDIYNLSEVKGNKLLVSTATANKLIADVWFARADFAEDHPAKIEGLVRGIFDSMEELKTAAGKQKAAELMAAGYNLPESEALAMMPDAHSTNWAENYQFLINQNNPANFERIWKQSYYLYRKRNKISHKPIPFDQVLDFSIIEKLGKEEKYSSQKDEYTVQFVPKTTSEIRGAEDSEILTNTVVIHFYPNSHELDKKINKEINGKTVEEPYDPNIPNVLKEVAGLAAQFGNARIIIEGHTDSSMKAKGSQIADLVRQLSELRANAVKERLANDHDLDPNQFAVEGFGWEKPADPGDPNNHAKNRRVEIKIYPAESGE